MMRDACHQAFRDTNNNNTFDISDVLLDKNRPQAPCRNFARLAELFSFLTLFHPPAQTHDLLSQIRVSRFQGFLFNFLLLSSIQRP